MQVRINRKPVETLKPAIERRLVPKRGPDAVEGRVLDGVTALAAASRNLMVLFGVAGGLAAVIDVAALFGVAAHEPRSLPLVIPLVLASAAFLAVFLPWAWRRRRARARERLGEVLARMPPAGTPVRADAQGLAVDGRIRPWGRLSVAAVDIARVSSGEGDTSYYIETLALQDDGGREIVLDAGALAQGRKLVDFAGRSLGLHP